MKPYYTSKYIVLIDHQPYWREVSTKALRSSGFVVDTLDSYDFLPAQECQEHENPDLVVLGCSSIRQEEQKLIDDVLARDHHLLVFCTFLSCETTRNLFLQGEDVCGIAVILFAPQMRSVCRINQFRPDDQTLPELKHSSREHGANF